MIFLFPSMKDSRLLAPVVRSDWTFDSILSYLSSIIEKRLNLKLFLDLLFLIDLQILNFLKSRFLSKNSNFPRPWIQEFKLNLQKGIRFGEFKAKTLGSLFSSFFLRVSEPKNFQKDDETVF